MLDESPEQVELALDSRRALAQFPELLVHLPKLLVHLVGQLPEPFIRPSIPFIHPFIHPPIPLVHAQGKGVDPAVESTTLLKNQPYDGDADAKHGDDFGRDLFHGPPL